MKSSIVAKVYTKGESRNATKRVILSAQNYIDAHFAMGPVVNMLYLTGWTCINCIRGAEVLCYETGLVFENYSNEKMVLRIVIK